MAPLDASIGRIAPLQGSPREGPERVPNLPFLREGEIGFTGPTGSTANSFSVVRERRGRRQAGRYCLANDNVASEDGCLRSVL
jgi:hypothetical protein